MLVSCIAFMCLFAPVWIWSRLFSLLLTAANTSSFLLILPTLLEFVFKGISCHVVLVSCSVVQNAASSFGCPSGTAGTPGLFTYLNAVMMSMSMSTGVDPVMHAVSPFTMLISQLNGLASQCMFVLLSGAVFARLSQPSQPVVCAEKALLCTGAADTR